MKKLVLTLVVSAFAIAVQASDDKGCGDKAGCCAQMKTVAQIKSEPKGDCCAAKQAQAKANTKSCTRKTVLLSPKAQSLAS